MKFTFLGTGTSQGIPVIACDCEVCQSPDPKDKRTRTAGMVEMDGKFVVIDTGPDFRAQMLREKVKRMDGVVFTHPHKDHIAGMDDIRSFNFRQRRDMDVYANELTLTALKREFYYVFEEIKYPGVPSVVVHEIEELVPFTVAGMEWLPIPVLHYRMPVFGYRIGDFAYITDANHIPERSMEQLPGLKVLVLNALRKKKHLSHFTLEEAIEIVQILKPERAYFTHLSHLMGTHAEVSKLLPPGIEIAYDGLTIEI